MYRNTFKMLTKKNAFIFILSLTLFISNVSANEYIQSSFIYKQTIKKDNVILLEFTNKINNKLIYFDALKSNLKPYIFYTTDIGGSIITNEKLRNLSFILQYNKWPNDLKILYIISVKDV